MSIVSTARGADSPHPTSTPPRLDRSFGPGGRIITRFGSLAVNESSLLLDPHGRAIVVGTYGRGRAHGLVLARYLVGG